MANNWKITDGAVWVFVSSSPRPDVGSLLRGNIRSQEAGGFYFDSAMGWSCFLPYSSIYWIKPAS